METKQAFGEYILQKRKALHLTQKELANAVFVSESAVSKWERGLSYPDITLIQPLCKILGVTEDELLTASEDSNYHTLEGVAKTYHKIKKWYQRILLTLIGISLLAVLLVNLANKHTLSYFFIVFSSECVFSSLFLVPTYLEKNKKLITLGSFTLSIILLLFTVNFYTHGSWFLLAATSTVLGLSLFFLPMVLSYLPISEKYRKYNILIYFLINTLLLFIVIFLAIPYPYIWRGVLITSFSLLLPWSIMFVFAYTHLDKDLKIGFTFGILGLFIFYVNGFIEWVMGKAPSFSGISLNSFTLSSRDSMNFLLCMLFFFGMLLFLLKHFFFSLRKEGIK